MWLRQSGGPRLAVGESCLLGIPISDSQVADFDIGQDRIGRNGVFACPRPCIGNDRGQDLAAGQCGRHSEKLATFHAASPV